MRQAGKRQIGTNRGRWAIAASVLAHLLVLALLLTHRWDLSLPAEQPDSPWEHIVTVQLAPRSHAAAASASKPTAILSRTPRPGETPLASPAHEPATVAPPAAPLNSPGAHTALAQSGGASVSAGDLSAALRHGVLGCANAERLSREERERCEEKLGAGATHDPVLAEGRDPRIQAYFDAVAKAKEHDKPWTPTRAIGAMGVGQDVPRYSNDRLPGIGCAIPFGAGAKPKLPSHWLKLGPCFIAPPKGPFSVEADITPPDQDLSHPPPRSGPQPPPKVRHEIAAGADASGPTLARDNSRNADGEKPPQ